MYLLFLAFALFTVIRADNLNCTFGDIEKDKGYLGMLVNGKPSTEAKNGEPHVELQCGGLGHRHLYFCLNGVLKPYYDWRTRCESCTFGDVEKDNGYSGMLVNGTRSSEAKNAERNVELLCGKERHRYVCLDGVLFSLREGRCGCDPVSKGKLGYENDKYTHHLTSTPKTSLDKLFFSGKYRNGTKWTRTCSSGPVVGESSSVCVGSKWVPTPGRCPHMCSTEQVRKDAGFSRVTSYSYPHSTLLKTGEKAQGFCSKNILRVEHYGLTCADGKWLPENVSCPEHLRTHYP